MCKPEESGDNEAGVLSQYTGIIGKNGPLVLGKGTFGTVYKAKKDGREYAVKVMSKEWEGLTDLEKRFIKSEINTLYKCEHQHIIGKHGAAPDACARCIIPGCRPDQWPRDRSRRLVPVPGP